jgi:hypothetical protein
MGEDEEDDNGEEEDENGEEAEVKYEEDANDTKENDAAIDGQLNTANTVYEL